MEDKKIKIISWEDAVLYGPNHPRTSTTEMETLGILVEETDNFIVVKNLATNSKKTEKPHPVNRKPNYFFIPRGMIRKIENYN